MEKKKINLIDFKNTILDLINRNYFCTLCQQFDKSLAKFKCDHQICFDCFEKKEDKCSICEEGFLSLKNDTFHENLVSAFENLKDLMNIENKDIINLNLKKINNTKNQDVSKEINKKELFDKDSNSQVEKDKMDVDQKNENSSEGNLTKKKISKRGSKVNVKDSSKEESGSQELDLNWKDENGNNHLHDLVQKNDSRNLKKYLKYKIDPNVLNNEGYAPIHLAILQNKVNTLKILLDVSDINIQTSDGKTPLILCAYKEFFQLFKLILTKNPDINIKDQEGKDVYDYSTSDYLKLLPKKEIAAKIDKKTKSKNKSVTFANDENKITIIPTSINEKELKLLNTFAKKFNIKISNEFKDEITHLVTSEVGDRLTQRTLKYLKGLLTHKWLLSFNWVEKSLENNEFLNEQEFELKGLKTQDENTLDAPKRSRTSQKKLFQNKKFYLEGKFEKQPLSKNDFKDLIELGGGECLSTLRNLSEEEEILYIVDVNSKSKLKQHKNAILSKDFLNLIAQYNLDEN